MRGFLAFALAALALAVPAATPAQQRPAQRDWTQTVAATPEGGFRMGNPAARVKVVEYLSMTCPHCAAFAQEGTPRLIADHVRTGRVSLEYRNFVLNPVDLAATLLTRCAGPAQFFRMSEHLFSTQGEWAPRVNAAIEAAGGERTPAVLAGAAEQGGLTAIAAQHGVPAARARACITDRAGVDRLIRIYQAASAAGVQGTPTFAINGRVLQANDWPSIQQAIRQAGG
jgi:protein-disulfide isomerase